VEKDLAESNARLQNHISDLESRKRAPLYQKKQEEELRAVTEKAHEAEVRAQEAEAKFKEAKVPFSPPPPSTTTPLWTSSRLRIRESLNHVPGELSHYPKPRRSVLPLSNLELVGCIQRRLRRRQCVLVWGPILITVFLKASRVLWFLCTLLPIRGVQVLQSV